MIDRFRNHALITTADVQQMDRDIQQDDWLGELFEFWVAEPDLAVSVAKQMQQITALIADSRVSKKARVSLLNQLPLLVWPALLLMHRAHHRAGNETPSAETFEHNDLLEFETDEQIEGVSAGLHIGFFRTEFVELDEATLQVLVKKHCGTIAQAMLEAGAAAARRLFYEETR